jgi:hypothetical protein
MRGSCLRTLTKWSFELITQFLVLPDLVEHLAEHPRPAGVETNLRLFADKRFPELFSFAEKAGWRAEFINTACLKRRVKRGKDLTDVECLFFYLNLSLLFLVSATLREVSNSAAPLERYLEISRSSPGATETYSVIPTARKLIELRGAWNGWRTGSSEPDSENTYYRVMWGCINKWFPDASNFIASQRQRLHLDR